MEQLPYGSVAKLAKYAIKYGSLTAFFLSPSFRVFTEDVVPRLVRHAQDVGLELQATRRGASRRSSRSGSGTSAAPRPWRSSSQTVRMLPRPPPRYLAAVRAA